MLLYFILFILNLVSSILCLTAEVFQSYGVPVSAKVLQQYGHFPEKLREEMKQQVKEMFYFGYDSYMQHAWPKDELNPIDCIGRGPDWDNPSNININDVLGNYSLTLIDALDALLVFGNVSEFHRGVRLVSDYVSFDQDVTVQVFESTIRVLGGLVSAHLFLTDTTLHSDASLPGYDNELLDMARDLTDRLSDALQGSPSGLPYPRVNLRYGVQLRAEKMYETCLAGAGSLILEFGLVSRLTGDPIYERLAKRAVKNLWGRRANGTGLLGNTIDVRHGEWIDNTSGVGAGMDSFYEYLLKAFLLFGDHEYWDMWTEIYKKIKEHTRIGPISCGTNSPSHPLYINVNMHQGFGTPFHLWVDALGAAFPAVQALAGDMNEAICLHNFYANLWRQYGALPERFDWFNEKLVIPLYPLRPELAESTYFLYRATKNPFYFHVGKMIVDGLNRMSRGRCGFATVHNVLDGSLEDRMESFFLSETLKYLYLLFDEENFVNKKSERVLFTTEGHIIPVLAKFQSSLVSELEDEDCGNTDYRGTEEKFCASEQSSVERKRGGFCYANNPLLPFALPIEEIHWSGAAKPFVPPGCSR